MKLKGAVTGPASGMGTGFRPQIHMSVWSSTIVGGFDFLIDTGSDITALTTIAFKRFRFKHRNVGHKVQAMGGIAANAPTYKFDPAVRMQALDLAGQVRTFSGFQLYAMETND